MPNSIIEWSVVIFCVLVLIKVIKMLIQKNKYKKYPERGITISTRRDLAERAREDNLKIKK